jgi:phosphoribosylformylglycinamidine synthase II
MPDIITDLVSAREIALQLGLIAEEFEKIVTILEGRTPTYTELGIFSVMWSEHCSYKNSISTLKTLPRSGGRLLVDAGEENAGLVDIGDGLAVAFKIESHNHPSAIEPYQGAATGVGGILRDIFTMGARPIAALNSLRFGSLDSARTKFLVRGVVHGIADYGNSFGVPTVAGEVYFDDCYQGNPLVNAMAVGIVEIGKTASAVADGIGNTVMIVGSRTGRDGIHGASLLASAVFTEAAESLRPTVQVGDPFTEKLLLEASLEAIGAGLVVGMQDMGAAGISCCTAEMSAKSGTGMKIDLDRVPLRETTMSAYEIMLSESQERMLVVVKPEDVTGIRAIFEKWDLQAEIIGEVTKSGRVQINYQGVLVADIPARALALGGDQTPVYTREKSEPKYLAATRAYEVSALPDVKNPEAILKDLLASPNIASKRWVYQQYDSMVRTNSLFLEGSDAAVIRVKGTTKGLAVKTDCNSRYVYLDPYFGAMIAVAESARNIACTGATPIGVTNCLNFGNPYDPEIFYQFAEAVRGMGEACRVLGTPVTGGNVSFYNENPNEAIYPTPTIGMVGLIEDITKVVSSSFKQVGDDILLLESAQESEPFDGIGGSEYLRLRTGKITGTPPIIDIEQEKKLIACLVELADKQLLQSAHDTSEGGLAVALAECCFDQGSGSHHGARIEPTGEGRLDSYLFAEKQTRVVLSALPSVRERITVTVKSFGLRVTLIGRVGGNELVLGNHVQTSVADLYDIYSNALSTILETEVVAAE